jgi:hypothetical protein
MQPTQSEILWPQFQCAELIEIFRTQMCEFIQQLAERFSLACMQLRQTIEGLKRARLAVLQNVSCARHPVRAVGVNQMAYDIEGAPGVFALISKRPFIGQITEKCV